MTQPMRPSRVPYFYGRISRDEAEQILEENGRHEGLFLLRESMSTAGNYALSICHNQGSKHYSIERQPDGSVMIQDGKKFKGPVELVTHHRKYLDGLLTRPTIPCTRPEGSAPLAWPGITMLELDQYLLRKAESMGLNGNQLENALGPQRQHFVALVAKELHMEQPWFHGRIERSESDQIMDKSKHKDGKFLVRQRPAGQEDSYALSLSFKKKGKHYRIDKYTTQNEDKFAIENGPRFDSIMDMIAHYHNRADGLLCKLTEPCNRGGHQSQRNSDAFFMETSNQIYRSFKEPVDNQQSPLVGAAADEDDASLRGASARPLAPARHSARGEYASPDDPQKIYDSVPRTEDVFNLDKNSLELYDKLGAGNFGSVVQGTYRRGKQIIPVAVKTLKVDNDLPVAKSELMSEARVMADLQHRNIVRMIGVCQSDMIMLVLELASLGPLHKYLKKHAEMSIKGIIELMFQVASGMAYLESKSFVHRDLAARNVLLVNERFAKISDFGMSRALAVDKEYYKADVAGKWPMKWYAPECIYYFRFDSKSDVWSYGVTLWEATSYGAKPYKGMRGPQILELIDQGTRLERPDMCPEGVFEIMFDCWLYNKDDRPSFTNIVERLRKFV